MFSDLFIKLWNILFNKVYFSSDSDRLENREETCYNDDNEI